MSVRPSILMVTGEYPPGIGGVGDYTARLSAHLVGMGARVVVLAGGPDAPGTAPPDSGRVQVVRGAGRWSFRSWHRVASVVAEVGADVIHIQYQAAAYGMHPAANLLPAYLRVRRPHLKVATTFHDLRVPYLFRGAGKLRREAVRALDRFSHVSVVTNQADMEDLGGPGDGTQNRRRRWLIPIGSNIDNSPPPGYRRDEWRRRLGADEETLVISYFGLMNHSKGVDLLVDAVGLLADRGVRLKLLIVGGEAGESDPTNRRYQDEVLRSVETPRLRDRVFRTGFVPDQQVSAYLLASDLCALPFRDGASLRRGSLLAAIVHGLPVVTTVPSQPESLLVDGENVVLVERGNPEALAVAIERLWHYGAVRHRVSRGAEEMAKRFGWPAIAARHMEMYRALLG